MLAVHPEIGTIVRHATPLDVLYVDSLRKKHGDELGFIPLQTYESIVKKQRMPGNRLRWLHDWLLVCQDNDDLTGFCYVGFKQRTASIVQICIQDDARRWHRAAMIVDLVEREARRRDCWSIKARVARDIEAVKFWRAVGYEIEGATTSTHHGRGESKSRRRIDLYRKHFIRLPIFGGEPNELLIA